MDDKIEMTREEIINQMQQNEIIKDDIEAVDDEIINIASSKRNLVTDKADPTIESLNAKFIRGKLVLQPDYQRKFVMKPQIASKLIESILLDIPLPTVYFAEEDDGTWSVVDGQQRLTAIISFITGKFLYDNKEFKLSGLNVLSELNRKTYKELEESYQEKIMNTSIRAIIIKKESNEDIKFEIFERLNTGSTPLNEDEIRNTIYRGKYMNLLNELEKNEVFDKIVDKPNFKKRMLYKGMILRFFAFYEKSYEGYKPSMKQFCNKHLKRFRNMDDDQIEEYKKIFKDTLDMVNMVFGNNAFRRMVKDEHSNNFLWIKTRINMALYDIQMYGFTKYKKEQIIPHMDEIREAMYELMTSNQDFIDAIEIRTSNEDMVMRRFRMWLDKLNKIVSSEKNLRFFSTEIKEKLYNEDSTCKLCGQKILNIDDAQVDHKLPYSKGGKTEIENAQITHRYCNQHKNNREE